MSCSADRQIKGKISAGGIFIEQLDPDPARFLPEPAADKESVVTLDLNQPMDQIRSELSQYPVTTRLALNGDIIVARDIAHAKLKERLDQEGALPDYFKDHIVYYAGPAKTPEGRASGAFGPTTAGRMDAYVPIFQKVGGSMVMLAKGNRSKQVTDACKEYGGFYLGSIGGPAARLGRDCITQWNCWSTPNWAWRRFIKSPSKIFRPLLSWTTRAMTFLRKAALITPTFEKVVNKIDMLLHGQVSRFRIALPDGLVN